MIEPIPRDFQRALEDAKVHDHSGSWIAFAAHNNLGTIGMAVDTPASLGVHAATRQGVRSIETKLLREFEHSRYPNELVSLQTEAPLRMAETIRHRSPGIGRTVRPVHRLKPPVPERKTREFVKVEPSLWVNQLQFRSGT